MAQGKKRTPVENQRIIDTYEKGGIEAVKKEYGRKSDFAAISLLQRARRAIKNTQEKQKRKQETTRKSDNPVAFMPAEAPDGKHDFAQNGNEAEFTYETHQPITSVENLLIISKVDMDIWQIDRHVINTWSVWSKIKGEMVCRQNHQVKVWLTRIEPKYVKFPALQSISAPEAKFTVGAPRKTSGWKTALIIPDMHVGYQKNPMTGERIPFHDRRCLDIAVQLSHYKQPDVIVQLGDLLDLAGWSDKYAKEPEFYGTAMPSLLETYIWLSRLNSKRMVVTFGNHDDRMNKQIISHLLEAYGLKKVTALEEPPVLTIESLLGFQSLGIETMDRYPHGEFWLNEELRCIHGENFGKHPGDKILADTNCSTIYGHCHTSNMAMLTEHGRGRKTHTAYTPGVVCHVDGRVPGFKSKGNWQQGLGIVYYDPDGTDFSITHIPIIKGRAFCEGVMFEAEPKHYADIDDIVDGKLKEGYSKQSIWEE